MDSGGTVCYTEETGQNMVTYLEHDLMSTDCRGTDFCTLLLGLSGSFLANTASQCFQG